MKFAKLFEVGEEQVLVVIEHEDDQSTVTISSDYEAARINQTLRFTQGDMSMRAQSAFDDFNQQSADAFRDQYANILE